MWRRIKQAWLAADLVLTGFSKGYKKVYVRGLCEDEGRPDVLWLEHTNAAGDWGSLLNIGGALYKTQCGKCGGWYKVKHDHAGVVEHGCIERMNVA